MEAKEKCVCVCVFVSVLVRVTEDQTQKNKSAIGCHSGSCRQRHGTREYLAPLRSRHTFGNNRSTLKIEMYRCVENITRDGGWGRGGGVKETIAAINRLVITTPGERVQF